MRSRIGVVPALIFALGAIAPCADAATTVRVSGGAGGVDSNGMSSMAVGRAVSADGRFVVFQSQATNLVAGDTNGVLDVFVHDCVDGTTTRMSVASSGVEANDRSFPPALSADGRLVAFQSVATNLVAGDGNGVPDVFVCDRLTVGCARASLTDGGFQADGAASVPSLSADDGVVAFVASATNLVMGDANSADDVYVRVARCGDGTVDAGEDCDDGNAVDGDGCNADCTVAGCGDHVVQPDEACDDGNLVDGDGCDADCTVPSCVGMRDASLVFDDLTRPRGEPNVFFRGWFSVPAGWARSTSDAEVRIEDLGAAGRVLLDATMSAGDGPRVCRPAPFGRRRRWKPGRPVCSGAPRNGVVFLQLEDRRRQRGEMAISILAKMIPGVAPMGPLVATVVFGGGDLCSAEVFSRRECVTTGRGNRVACR